MFVLYLTLEKGHYDVQGNPPLWNMKALVTFNSVYKHEQSASSKWPMLEVLNIDFRNDSKTEDDSVYHNSLGQMYYNKHFWAKRALICLKILEY